jgi:hypothetical protein
MDRKQGLSLLEEHILRMLENTGKMRKTYILIGKPEWRRPPWRYWQRYENYIDVDLTEIRM